MTSLIDGATDPAATVDPTKNYLEELVGDGKKFKSPEELAKGKYLADEYVKILERRLDERNSDYQRLSEEYNAGPKLKELIDQIEQKRLASTTAPNEEKALTAPAVEFDWKKVEEVAATKFQEIEASRRRTENFNQMKAKLLERYGSNYQTSYTEQVKALGLSVEYADDLAKNYPAVFLKTFGLDRSASNEQFQTPPKNARRNDSFSPTGTEKKTWGYFQKLKQTNPNLYKDPKTAVEMHDAAIALKEEFWDS